MQISAATLEKSLAVSYKAKHTYHKTCSFAPRHSSNFIKNSSSEKDLNVNVYRRFIHCPKLETTQISFSR